MSHSCFIEAKKTIGKWKGFETQEAPRASKKATGDFGIRVQKVSCNNVKFAVPLGRCRGFTV